MEFGSVKNLSPNIMINSNDIHSPIGINKAHYIASNLGLNKNMCFTSNQFDMFITGKGIGGSLSNSSIIDECVKIFTNTTGNSISVNIDGTIESYVLSSYGLFVNETGMLMSLANTDSPCRQVNTLIAPGGYVDQWCRNNNAQNVLYAIYRMSFLIEAYYGFNSQSISGLSQLVPYYIENKYSNNTIYVGMSMCPSIWITNFWFLYVLNPHLAAMMPAYWTPIPMAIVIAMSNSSNGQVQYLTYKNLLVNT